VSECIEWPGGHWSTGYPYRCATAAERAAGAKRLIAVHREVWEQANGPIPPGQLILHACDNRGCINLEHLRCGSPRENSQDMAAKGRASNQAKTHCPNGHPYDRVAIRRGARAGEVNRYCSICANERKRRRYVAR
jgi:hypothetical protein